jgi:hypothetical protein
LIWRGNGATATADDDGILFVDEVEHATDDLAIFDCEVSRPDDEIQPPLFP